MRTLAPDGKNVGYLHSTSFSFVAARHVPSELQSPQVVRSGRYPYLSLDAPGAADTVLAAAQEYRRSV